MGSPLPSSRKKVTVGTIRSLHKKKEPITVITAYDFPSAHVADAAGMDIILVGDSLAMVALGMEDTSEVVVEEMILHCRSVARATKAAMIIGDLPMGSYEIGPDQALQSAIRFVKEGRVHGIKLEGGAEMAPTIKKITSAGIPVLAHIGLTPQRQNALGGFRVQGKTADGALSVLQDALAVQEAGALRPFLPKFVKKYGDVWSESLRAIETYRDEVKSRQYPAPEHTYPISNEELAAFEQAVKSKE
ncbi:unnamed protein product [Parascedosporium putredinis]|uniref:3-methyl-2-oxobutanoate hydroxymethyltransferase n=1 Tax=Parascedosporium putredinis TaxID=1442378 RepID=A0A9P1HD43_9PEZI|nr:unnamed protein product [Parascedosporium putredinis]CAI8003718.1 unnamed protein product [Parascedosporium putredinis]